MGKAAVIQQFIREVAGWDGPVPMDNDKILSIYTENRENFVQALVASETLPEKVVLSVLGKIYGMPLVRRPAPPRVPSSFLARVSIQFLKAHCMVLHQEKGKRFEMVMNDPVHLSVADDLARVLGMAGCKKALGYKNDILSAINTLYDQETDSARQLVADMTGNGSAIIQEIEETADLLDDTSSAPVIKLVNHMISQSVKARASDIHIEPFQDSITVRYRIDGILYDMLSPPRWVQSALTSRIKVMADMNIAEKTGPPGRPVCRAHWGSGDRYPGFHCAHRLWGTPGHAAAQQIPGPAGTLPVRHVCG